MEEQKQRPNYYVLLELSYDPPEMDAAVIEQAIKKKNAEWNRLANNPRKGKLATQWRNMIPHIRQVMLDDALRIAEANEAKKLVNVQQQQQAAEINTKLTQAIAVCLAKGMITDLDIERISETYEVSIEDVKALLDPNQKIEQVAQMQQVEWDRLPEDVERKIATVLHDLHVKPSKGKIATLYDFVELTEDASSADILAQKAKIIQDLQIRPPSVEVSNRKDVCGHIETIFSNDDMRQKYDRSIQYSRFLLIQNMVDFAGSSGVIVYEQFKEFVSHCVANGLKEAEATNLITYYCQRQKYTLSLVATVSTNATTTSHACPNCGRFNSETAQNCSSCGINFMKECLSCGTVSSIMNEGCSSCSLSFEKMMKYEQLYERGQQALISKDLVQAEQCFEHARLIVQREQVEQAIAYVKQRNKDVQQLVTQLAQVIQQKRFSKALAMIQSLKNIVNVEEDATIQQYVVRVEHEVAQSNEQLANIAKLADGKTAALLQLLERYEDNEWALSMLAQQPPTLPENVNVYVEDDAIKLTWQNAEPIGNITYHIYRTEDEGPKRIRDGELLIETEALSFTDLKTKPNKNYWYSVFASRGAVKHNRPAIRGPISRVEEVDFQHIELRDEEVHLRWHAEPHVTSVVVRKENEASTSVHDGDIVYKGNGTYFCDSTVTQNKVYVYTIFSEFHLADKTIVSNGVSRLISLISLKPPIVSHIIDQQTTYECHIQNKNDLATGQLKIFRSPIPFTEASGTLIDAATLHGKYKDVVPHTMMNDNVALIHQHVFESDYLLFTIMKDDLYMIGSSTYVENVPTIESVHVTPQGNQQRITWTWPANVEKVYVYIRAVSENGVDETTPLMNEVISKSKYNQTNGIVIDKSNVNTIDVSLSNVNLHENVQILSKYYREMMTFGEKISIAYSVIKKGLFRKKTFLQITWPPQVNVLPKFDVVLSPNGLPLTRSEGTSIYTFTDTSNVNATSLEIDVTPYVNKQVSMYARLFFIDEAQAKNYMLQPVGSTKI